MTDSSSAPRRHDRLIVIGLLVIVTALAWAYTIHQAREMAAMDAAMWRDMNMSMNGMAASWTALDAVLMFAMWSVMMAAMMLPGAGPMVAVFATINQRRRERGAAYVPTAIFIAGYLIVWCGFSLVATALQWLLQTSGLLTTMMQSASYYFSAALFVAAGLYQFSPLKERCLSRCRSPDGFILSEWRDGALGALVMGLRHGLFCAGCCIGLMLLLFAVAVMDLRWVAALAILVTAEKLLPHPRFWRLGIGAALIAAGVAFALAGLHGGTLA
jgi:predicted metal-binding membrane protein